MLRTTDKRVRVYVPNRLFDLPSNILSLIYEFDDTYHKTYKQVLEDLKAFPIWNISYLQDNASNCNIYYCKKIATDMLYHWNYHYTSFINSILSNPYDRPNEERILVNYLDTNHCGSSIPGRKETIFEWIEYYNLVISR